MNEYDSAGSRAEDGKELPDKTIRVLVVEPGRYPYAAEIGADLASMQKVVGGLIEPVYCFDDDPAVLVCHEEEK